MVVFVKGGKVKKGRIIADGEAIRLQPKIFWMQLGITSQEAVDILTDVGIDVIMGKCIKVEHARLCKTPSC